MGGYQGGATQPALLHWQDYQAHQEHEGVAYRGYGIVKVVRRPPLEEFDVQVKVYKLHSPQATW
mgnify:CR=1 FL=1